MASYRALLLHFANLNSRLTPPTTGFRIRLALFSSAGVRAHKTARICGGTTFDNVHASIGAGTWIGAGTRFIGGKDSPVVVGNNCDVGPSVLFVTGSHALGGPPRRAGKGYTQPITIGSGCWIGARATILPGVNVGASSIVAAGAVVTSDVPPNSLVGGVPARLIRGLE